jgi:geranylgeranyl diphosphate synthase type I
MDIYAEACALLANLPVVKDWPAMQGIFGRTAARRPREWELPALACEAAGGDAAHVLPAVAAVACLQISILLIDDLLDDDPRGEFRRIGSPAAANLAAAFQAASLEALYYGLQTPSAQQAAVQVVNRMALSTALGQSWDVANPSDEPAYWRMVSAKSGPLYGAALEAGALCGGAPVGLARQLGEWGRGYGEIVQIHDDLSDSLATPASPDWIQGRASLPILFAQIVQHPEQVGSGLPARSDACTGQERS